MRKYILIIIFLLGMLLSFYSGYNLEIANHQTQLILDAMSSNDYEFLLKFNSYYDLTPEYENDYLIINKIYYEETLGYNIIIKQLDDETIELNSELVLSIELEDSTYECELYTSTFSYYNVLNVQVPLSDLSSNIVSITLSNETSEVFSYNISIDISELTQSYITSQDEGFTQEEIEEMSVLSSYNSLLVQMGAFVLMYIVCVGLYFGISRYLKNKV